jgi:hypothetical protein
MNKCLKFEVTKVLRVPKVPRVLDVPGVESAVLLTLSTPNFRHSKLLIPNFRHYKLFNN